MMPPVSAAIPSIPSCCAPLLLRTFLLKRCSRFSNVWLSWSHLRKLAHPAIPLDEAEEELLFQFEHSGEWLPDDTTLVADWYWRTSAALLSH